MKQPTHLVISRYGDTLSYSLDPETSARWWSTHDSVVVECLDCEQGYSKVVEHFTKFDTASIVMESADSIRFTIYSGSITDTMIVSPTQQATTAAAPRRRIAESETRRRRTKVTADKTPEPAKTPDKTPDTKAVETTKTTDTKAAEKKVVKKTASIKVIAPEGVPIYKDKSKTEVLRILQKGEVLPYLSKEGDMYSVSVGDTEGFIEAEAVEQNQ